MIGTPLERFNAYAMPIPESGCWLWTGPISHKGYGRFTVDGRKVQAHRFSYKQFVGPVPDETTIDHLCRVRCFVNPDHLRQLSNRDNILIGVGPTAINAKKVQCSNGHIYTKDTTIERPEGGRGCRICKSKYNKNYRIAHGAEV